MLSSQKTTWHRYGLALIRIITGGLVAYHGLEVFDDKIMDGYLKWDIIKRLPAPVFMVYLGKSLELVAGVCFIVGLFTRIAAVLIAAVMLFICFYVGKGKFYYEDQHPFLLALLAMVFFFTGPVKWSMDQKFFSKKQY